MEQSQPLHVDYLQRLNRWRRGINASMLALRVLRSLLLALCAFLLWAWVSPEQWGQQLLVFALAFIVFLSVSWQKGLRLSTLSEWLLALEMSYPQTGISAFRLGDEDAIGETWQEAMASEWHKQKREHLRLLLSKAASLLIPALCLAFLLQGSGQAWGRAIHSIQRLALSLSYGAELRVVEGWSETGDGPSFALGKGALDLTLLEQNLVEIKVTAAPDAAPLVQLKDKEGKATQTFRLTRTASEGEESAIGRFTLTFALSEDTSLFLSTISTRNPAAVIHVKKLPVPDVTLSSLASPDEAWPDDKPLPLTIHVKAEHPLQTIHLLIKSGERNFRELVSEVLAQDKQELDTTYNLPLETYLEQDIQDLEIIAEATDRAMPKPLVGRSKPLVIKVASAYGRYRQTLETLKEQKKTIDEALQQNKLPDAQQLQELSEKATRQADDSPYFDGLDRQTIRQLQEIFERSTKTPNMPAMMAASEELNRFLFEHESLDDRERDRDFFIAARTLSRMLEQKASERKVSVPAVVARTQAYLAERQKRWEARVQRLEAPPAEWTTVQAHPFAKALEKIEGDDAKLPPATQAALGQLSQTVESYRQWIEALEAKEDAARKQQEQKRQQGLANAQNQLRELQRRQSLVSSKLDKAAAREQKDLSESWASVRLEQNSNIKGTRELEGQLRSLSPTAGERIKAAIEAMESTVGEGNGQKFVEAETSSDFAGRLLQQAESAAQRSQQEQGKRGRRRRVTSDQYYGNQVAGGDVDLRRDYEVNRRYREDVLDDVRQIKKKETSEEDDALLEDYLRKVVR